MSANLVPGDAGIAAAAHGVKARGTWRRWTPSDDEFLRANYTRMQAAEMGAQLDRTMYAVQRRLCDLQLLKQPRSRNRLPAAKARPQRFNAPRFADELAAECDRRGVSVSGACDHNGVARSAISRMRTNPRHISAEVLLVLCSWAGFDPMDFMEDAR